jgi:hypothetical protein
VAEKQKENMEIKEMVKLLQPCPRAGGGVNNGIFKSAVRLRGLGIDDEKLLGRLNLSGYCVTEHENDTFCAMATEC